MLAFILPFVFTSNFFSKDFRILLEAIDDDVALVVIFELDEDKNSARTKDLGHCLQFPLLSHIWQPQELSTAATPLLLIYLDDSFYTLRCCWHHVH
jgi:hypothetical protein